ncbi:hypothetical protein [Methylobacterium brachiatum]|uniref:hypothetical protein n=1 Tax=Methylobacterium brachiatum TaxID=269660 RepID=UPI0008E6972D|nr:hypothetical protein [Methylobacterium brachiatum]SFJ68999.1 hypothetical protein SAMN02799642_05193 [Methylobacterium brachiatum]
MRAHIYTGDSPIKEEGTKAAHTVDHDKVSEVAAAAYALMVLGDELAPRVQDGEVVVIDVVLPETGDLALVQLVGSDVAVLRVLGPFDSRWLAMPRGDCEPMIELILLHPQRRSDFVPVSSIDVLRRARVVR